MKRGMAPTGRLGRERAFYDAHAAAAGTQRGLDGYDAAILSALGPVEGLRVLEVGCGRGDLTLELLRRGAHVTAIDISPGMVEATRRRAGPLGAEVTVAPVEDTGLLAGSFDRAVGKWVIHHADVPATAAELTRVLRPGGTGVFFENQDRNPLLRAARRLVWRLPGLQRVGTPDERPLSVDDLEALRGQFAELELRFPSLYLFEALSRALGHRAHRRLRGLDAWLWRRVPRLRPYGWHVLLVLRAAAPRAPGR